MKKKIKINGKGKVLSNDQLVRVTTFAVLLGEKFRPGGKPYTPEAIWKMLKENRIPDRYTVTIDGTLFISTEIFNEMQAGEVPAVPA